MKCAWAVIFFNSFGYHLAPLDVLRMLWSCGIRSWFFFFFFCFSLLFFLASGYCSCFSVVVCFDFHLVQMNHLFFYLHFKFWLIVRDFWRKKWLRCLFLLFGCSWIFCLRHIWVVNFWGSRNVHCAYYGWEKFLGYVFDIDELLTMQRYN